MARGKVASQRGGSKAAQRKPSPQALAPADGKQASDYSAEYGAFDERPQVVTGGSLKEAAMEYTAFYTAPALAQVDWVKRGLGAREAKSILGQLRLTQGEALSALQIPVATVNRKAKTNAPLATAEAERVLGLGRLIGQVQLMVQESGNPEGFDAAAWLSEWMITPVPALGGTRPLDLMDTMTGQALVSQVLSQMQSGAYA